MRALQPGALGNPFQLGGKAYALGSRRGSLYFSVDELEGQGNTHRFLFPGGSRELLDGADGG